MAYSEGNSSLERNGTKCLELNHFCNTLNQQKFHVNNQIKFD